MKVSMPNLHTSTALRQPECRIFQEKHERFARSWLERAAQEASGQ
jgi:hypothetical protein